MPLTEGETRATAVPSAAFRVPVSEVLDGAADADLAGIVVLGVHKNGKVYAAASDGTPRTLEIIQRGTSYIKSLLG